MEVKLTLWIENNKTRQDLLNDIDNAFQVVKDYEEMFKMYAIANPKDITPADHDPIGFIQGQMNEQLDFYRDAVLDWMKALEFMDAYDDYQEELKKAPLIGAKLYKPGDVVQVKSGLTPDTHIGGTYCTDGMAKLAGHVMVIESIDDEYGYVMKGNDSYFWTDAMLTLLVSKEETQARHDTGDPR